MHVYTHLPPSFLLYLSFGLSVLNMADTMPEGGEKKREKERRGGGGESERVIEREKGREGGERE